MATCSSSYIDPQLESFMKKLRVEKIMEEDRKIRTSEIEKKFTSEDMITFSNMNMFREVTDRDLENYRRP